MWQACLSLSAKSLSCRSVEPSAGGRERMGISWKAANDEEEEEEEEKRLRVGGGRRRMLDAAAARIVPIGRRAIERE